MRRQNIISGVASAAGILVLILDSRTAIDGAAEGIDLCIRTVIPSLFPFIFLSNIFRKAFGGMPLPALRPLTRLFSMPKGSEVLLIPAFLGGYPVGAQCVASLYSSGQLSKESANRLLAYCNNAGPAFLFGLLSLFFRDHWMLWGLWLIHLFSAFLVSLCPPCPDTLPQEKSFSSETNTSSSMLPVLTVMGCICGWIVVFRILIRFLERWILWIFPVEIQVILTGILELSNGCCCLGQIASIPLRFAAASGFLAFGGICVTLQTTSVIKDLSLKKYLLGKSLQTVFSVLLSLSLFDIRWAVLTAFAIAVVTIPCKIRKKSSNSIAVGV